MGFAAILGIWQFPFQNLSWTGILESETQIKIRMILTGATIVFVILSLTYILHGRYRKYKQTHKLTDEELENVLKHMNESS